MIACFLSNISTKYYKNPSMLSRVIGKNVGDVFLRHSVVAVVPTGAAEAGTTAAVRCRRTDPGLRLS